jgi:hypothetical protein
MCSPARKLKIDVMRKLIAATGNATNELRGVVSLIAIEFVVAGGHGTTETAVARELMSDATIRAGSGASNGTSEGLTVARDTVVGSSGLTSAGSMAISTANVASNGLVSGGSAKSIVATVGLTSGVSMSVVPRDVTGDTLSAAGTERTPTNLSTRQTNITTVDLASRAGPSPSPTCQPGKVVSRTGMRPGLATNRDARAL